MAVGGPRPGKGRGGGIFGQRNQGVGRGKRRASRSGMAAFMTISYVGTAVTSLALRLLGGALVASSGHAVHQVPGSRGRGVPSPLRPAPVRGARRCEGRPA